MLDRPHLINGGSHSDHRGKVSFVNGFDMTLVKRCYHIMPADTNSIRAWQGHRLESKWFYCTKGSFEIGLVRVEDWNSPSKDIEVEKYILSDTLSDILYIPPGYVNGFKAIEEASNLSVYSNFSTEESIDDDYRFPADYWEF